MAMRAPVSDLPLMLDAVRIVAGKVTILDRLSLTVTPGAPTVLIGG
jgi:tungstate transport system ATP-binding protein